MHENKIAQAFQYIEKTLISSKTNIIYDHNIHKDPNEWPTPDECESSFPNPSGYGTGMEDGMISGGTMLDGCILLYKNAHDKKAADMARRIVSGMLGCAEAAKDEGFIPRALSPIDGKSHYIESSKDQFTLFVFGMHRYYNSSLCSEAEKIKIRDIAVKIAKRAEKNVNAENGYDILCENGAKTINAQMWGDSLGNHEYLRLPMIYLFAWEVSGIKHFLDLYTALREEAINRSLPMTSYWHLYAVHQMQLSARLCYDADPDKQWRDKILELMKAVNKYILSQTDRIRSLLKDKSAYNMPQAPFRECLMNETPHKKNNLPCQSPLRPDAEDYWTLQDAAVISIIYRMVPGTPIDPDALRLLYEAFDKIDFKMHQRSLPVHFFDALCRTSFNEKF